MKILKEGYSDFIYRHLVSFIEHLVDDISFWDIRKVTVRDIKKQKDSSND